VWPGNTGAALAADPESAATHQTPRGRFEA
jgi:hypothetical protein